MGGMTKSKQCNIVVRSLTQCKPMQHLTDLTFHNRFHSLGTHFYSECPPLGLENPTLVCSSAEVLHLLNLHPDEATTDLFLQVFSGNALLPGMQPLAQDYAGHQFGHFNPFLGDGRALLLGEVETPTGILDIYLKAQYVFQGLIPATVRARNVERLRRVS
jgi:uncharacterized protein YdiU (UPF0061 family)